MKQKSYAFKNERGELINYIVKEYLSVNSSDYVIMSPENKATQLEIYKFNLENGNEYLDAVKNQGELNLIKASAKTIWFKLYVSLFAFKWISTKYLLCD